MQFPTVPFSFDHTPSDHTPSDQFPTVRWGETEATFIPAGAPIPNLPITASLVFALQRDEFLLGDIADRGWCIPGGRLEAGETPEQAAHREAMEEIGATLGPLVLLGHYLLQPSGLSQSKQKEPEPKALRSDASETEFSDSKNPETCPSDADHSADGDDEESLSSVQSVGIPHTRTSDSRARLAIAYCADVLTLSPLPKGTESRGVRACSFDQLPTVYYAWDPLLEAMFTYVHTRHIVLRSPD